MSNLPDQLHTIDGLALHLRQWPAPYTARGSVLIVHGLGEHIGRYERVAADLNHAGWSVLGYDQRGHGRSQGARGAIGAADDLLADLASVVDAARTTMPGPLTLLGHSMGGVVAARFVAEGLSASPASWHRPVQALVLSSPALDLGLNAAQKLLLATLGALAPGLTVGNGLKPAWISHDEAVVRAYRTDPLVHDRVTPRLVRFIVDAGVLARQQAQAWSVPTLLLYAGTDRCVAPAGSADFAARAPASVVQARRFDNLLHEILNEPQRDDVLAELLPWIRSFSLSHGTALP
jgi:alpha-beta hydrolase superfamily lysophospholipase